jgi:hypothetical protein
LASSRPAICSVAVTVKLSPETLAKAATLKFVLQGFALSFGAFEYCIGVADRDPPLAWLAIF